MSFRLAIVDYGTGNIASLGKAIKAAGADSALVSQPADLAGKDAVILPGVGHYGPASASLRSSGLAEALREHISAGLPVLGICLGFQLLANSSEEAPGCSGLGLLPLASHRLSPHNTRLHKVPHLGWNTLEMGTSCSRLLQGIDPEQQRFYFANAYAIAPDPHLSAVQATYCHENSWLGLVELGSICGVQFHPEKSRNQGLKLLCNFLALAAERR